MTKKINVAVLSTVVFTVIGICSKAQTWQWERHAGGYSTKVTNAITRGDYGFLYAVGNFFGNSISLGSVTLTNADSLTQDVYLVRYSVAGDVIWAKKAGGLGNNMGTAIASDNIGNVIIAGTFNGSSMTLDTITLTNPNPGSYYSTMFIAKYNMMGDVLWAKVAGSSRYNTASALAVGPDNSIVICGEFDDPTDTFGSTVLTSNGESDLLVVKYDNAGNFLWAKNGGGATVDEGTSVAVNPAGDIFVCGLYYSSTFTLDGFSKTNAGNSDLFIAKLNSSGNVQWMKGIGGTGSDEALGIATDESGHIYCTGTISSPSLAFQTAVITNTGINSFLVMYDAAGSEYWVRNTTGHSISANSIATYQLSSTTIVSVSGFFYDSALSVGSVNLLNKNPNFADIFVLTMSSTDTQLRADLCFSAGGFGHEHTNAICYDQFAGLDIAGDFESSVVYFGGDSLINSSSEDMFVARLSPMVNDVKQLTADAEKTRIFPNPASSLLTVVVPCKNMQTISIYNLLGVKVLEANASGLKIVPVYTANLPSGTYILKASGVPEIEAHQFILVH